MHSDMIAECLMAISQASSTRQKMDYIKEFSEDELFVRILVAAYDPMVTYGLTKASLRVDSYSSSGEFTEKTFDLLKGLSKRTITGLRAVHTVNYELERLSKASGNLLVNIICKDLRAGISAITINNALGAALIPCTPYMRCTPESDIDLKKLPWELGLFSQEKMDGTFVNVVIQEGGITLLTRDGKKLPNMSDLMLEIDRDLEVGYVYHGELLVFDDGELMPRKSGNGIINSCIKVGKPLGSNIKFRAVLWDVIPVYNFTSAAPCNVGYDLRLVRIPHKWRVPYRVVFSLEEADEHYADVMRTGGEGTVLKLPDGVWKPSKSTSYIKRKALRDCDLRIIGFNEGNGKYQGALGSLVCVSEDGELVVNVSGLTDRERREMWSNKEEWLHKIVTVRYNEVIRNEKGEASLFLPRFVEVRMDKLSADNIGDIK